MPDHGGSVPSYILGHSEFELNRLRLQARLIDPFTRKLLQDAGVGPGMRVLDVGSGSGNVAFLLAELVGEHGQVIGIDVSPEAVVASKREAQTRQLNNVQFIHGDAAEITFEEAFDAVVGRYVLLFVPDQSRLLQHLARQLRPRGVLVSHEPDWSFSRSIPPSTIYDDCCRWLLEVGRAAGTPWEMSTRLFGMFDRAGLPTPTMLMQTVIGAGNSVADWLQSVVDLVEVLLPSLERYGIVSPGEADLSSLVSRMTEQIDANRSVVIGRAEVGAWCRA